MAQFNSYLNFLNLSAATDYCREKGQLCQYKKGERFVQQGSIARYAALVVSGYFKVVTLNDSGDETVVNFAFPGQFITDFHSSIHGNPSQTSIIAGSDCEILRVPLRAFKNFFLLLWLTNTGRCSIWCSCVCLTYTASHLVSVMWNCANNILRLSIQSR